jgi:hypothetical protein
MTTAVTENGPSTRRVAAASNGVGDATRLTCDKGMQGQATIATDKSSLARGRGLSIWSSSVHKRWKMIESTSYHVYIRHIASVVLYRWTSKMFRHPNVMQSTADANVDSVDVTAASGMAEAADGNCDECLRTRALARRSRLASRRMFWSHRHVGWAPKAPARTDGRTRQAELMGAGRAGAGNVNNQNQPTDLRALLTI